jgi:fatty-acid desaturase
MRPDRIESAACNWGPALMFLLTSVVALTAVPWYGLTHGYHAATLLWFVLLLGANGMAITGGYHRLFTHASYRAHSARAGGVADLRGEGYHNFHHSFPHDDRNGVRWWQWDRSKWFIGTMHTLGLASNLKRVPEIRIRRAQARRIR